MLDTLKPNSHRHPVNVTHVEDATFGQRAAEKMARYLGSWKFLITQTFLLASWIILNFYEVFTRAWDPYPFILLNLMLSFQAAYTGPILLIASNRQTERDRLLLEHDAQEIELERQTLGEQKLLLEQNTKLTKAVHDLTQEVHRVVVPHA